MEREQIASFDTSKLAREKGFPQDTYTYYLKDGKTTTDMHYMGRLHEELTQDLTAAPTLNYLKKWFRDKYNIHVEVNKFFDMDKDLSIYKDITKDNVPFIFIAKISDWREIYNTSESPDTPIFMPKHYHLDGSQDHDEELEKGLVKALELI